MSKKRKNINTTFNKEIYQQLQLIKAKTGKNINELLEEGAKFIIKKYSKNNFKKN